MSCKAIYLLALSVVGATVAPLSHADTVVGYVSYNVTSSNQAVFNVVNQTGPNSSTYPDATFPVSNTVTLSDLNLVVDFPGGTTETYGSSYFTQDADGISWDGGSLSTASGPPTGLNGATSATLTGTFSTTTFDLNDGTTVTVDPTFSATITDSSGLTDLDSALIIASPATGVAPTPEPEPLILVATGLVGLLGFRFRRLAVLTCRSAGSFSGIVGAFAIASVLLMGASARSQVKLNTWASPSNPAPNTTVVLTGSGFPTGKINPSSLTVSFGTTCMGTAVATENPTSVTALVGTSDRVQIALPSTLTTGNYFVSFTGSASSSNCSEVSVTQTPTELAACVPTSSLAVTVGSNVTAYVPFGSWYYGTTGIAQVPIEGSGTATTFATTDRVNSCASNSVTGEVICTENNTNVDLISGTTLTTITSGSNAYAEFSGGSCYNCGVAVNAVNNTALIAMGLASGGYGYYGGNSGVQVLNLSNNSFNTPVPLANYVSEDVSIDPGRNLILSPAEEGVYDLLKIGTGNTLTEYGNYIGGVLDSAAEDCTTGIALASDEFSDDIYITDLTQATFTAGSPGTWTAPGQFINLNDGNYSAGTCGLSSAPGTGHMAVVTGEFGGSAYSALLLPSTSGSGTPTLADQAYVTTMPDTPAGNSFSAGYDPHTITAYTSPNTGKSYAVFVDNYNYVPDYLAVVDLACVLSQPRSPGTNTVVGNASACTRFVTIP